MKKFLYLSILACISLFAVGCLGLDFGTAPKPSDDHGSDGLTISGTVYLDSFFLELDNAKIYVDDKEIAADENGRFTITNMKAGEKTFDVMTPIGSRTFQQPIYEAKEEFNITIPLPAGFDVNLFPEITNLRHGTRRWENRKVIHVAHQLPIVHQLKLMKAFEYWLEDLMMMNVVSYDITRSEDADITVYVQEDLTKDGNTVMVCIGNEIEDDKPTCNFNRPSNGIMEKVHIIINEDYLANEAPYYIGVGEALGLVQVERGNTIMKADPENPDASPTASDRLYMNALYSLKPGKVY